MTQEDKELLLVDLLARLPYGVKIRLGDYDYQVCGYNSEKELPVKIWYYYNSNLNLKSYIDVYLTDYCPYLRPMSSMTEEEVIEFNNIPSTKNYQIVDGDLPWDVANHKQLDWLNKNMFDYHGLIPKGLALEAPKGMYRKEEIELI